MTWSFCNFPWRERFHVSPARSPPAQTVLTQRHKAVPFRLPARRAVVHLRPSRLQKMSTTFLDETRTRSSPGGSLREHAATHGFTLIPTFLDGSHTVRAVEGGPCVPPLPPQVPRMAGINVSVATATFLRCFESLEVHGPPIEPSSHPLLTPPLLSFHHHPHAPIRALLPTHCLLRPAR